MISRIEAEGVAREQGAGNDGHPAEAAIAPWQVSLREAVSTTTELLAKLDLPPDLVPEGVDRTSGFSLRVPESFVARMRPRDPEDPLLRQVLPTAAELEVVSGFVEQPLEETFFSPLSGLIQKYRGRVLLVTTGACAVNCRYCFRRNFPYVDQRLWSDDGRAVLDYVASDPSIREVILSGGDPLVVSDRRLSGFAKELSLIPHVETLRIHTRLPIVLPSRVDEALAGWLTETRLQTVVVVHCNHAQEIDRSVHEAVSRLRGAGCTVLNQAVLLAGINDSLECQIDLSRTLFRAGILPYYLHVLDRVQGAAHFDVAEPLGREIVQGMREALPGYLVPKLVREVPGAGSKDPL